MDITEVLTSLSEPAKQNFLQQLLPRADKLSKVDYRTANDEAAKLSVSLGVEYLLAKKQDDEAIAFLEDAGEYLAAAELSKRLDKRIRAVENYERAGEIKLAVDTYLGVEYKLDDEKEDEDQKMDQIPLLEDREDYVAAAELCRHFGMIPRAIRNLRLAKQDEMADRLAETSDAKGAVQVWLHHGRTTEAANLLYRNELFADLAELNEQQGYFVSAGSGYRKVGDVDAALRCYYKANFDLGIVDLLKEENRIDELLEYWEETENIAALAAHFSKKDPLLAMNCYLLLEDYISAAKCLREAKQPLEGLQLLVERGLFMDAIEYGSQIERSAEVDGDRLQSLLTQCYDVLAQQHESSDPAQAFAYYAKLKRVDKVKELATTLMERAAAVGDFTTAADYARKAGNSRAVDLFTTALRFLAD